MYKNGSVIINVSNIQELHQIIQEAINKFYLYSLDIFEKKNNIDKHIYDLLTQNNSYQDSAVYYRIYTSMFYTEPISFTSDDITETENEIIIETDWDITISDPITTIIVTQKVDYLDIPVELSFREADRMLIENDLIHIYRVYRAWIYRIETDDEKEQYIDIRVLTEFERTDIVSKVKLKKIKLEKSYIQNGILKATQHILKIKRELEKVGTIQLVCKFAPVLDSKKVTANKITTRRNILADLYIIMPIKIDTNISKISDTIETLLEDQIVTIFSNNFSREQIRYGISLQPDKLEIIFSCSINENVETSIKIHLYLFRQLV